MRTDALQFYPYMQNVLYFNVPCTFKPHLKSSFMMKYQTDAAVGGIKSTQIFTVTYCNSVLKNCDVVWKSIPSPDS